MTLSDRDFADLILRIRRHQITTTEFESRVATINDPQQELKIDNEWRSALREITDKVTRNTLDVAFANGKLDKDLIKLAEAGSAWGPERSHARSYGDKLMLVAYDEDSGIDNRARLNHVIEAICHELGLLERRYFLRGTSPGNKKFWLIEYLRLQELAKELVNRGRLDLLSRLTAGWTRGDYDLAADFIETDKVFKGPAKGVLEAGTELKDENMGKIMFEHRDTWRPLVSTLMSFSESWKTLKDAIRKASSGSLTAEDLGKMIAEKPLIEEKWIKVSLNGAAIRPFQSGDSISFMVWDNRTFWSVANTPDLEYYVTRLALDRSSETRDGVWTKARQIDLAQAVGKSQKFLEDLERRFEVVAGERDVVRHRTILDKVWMPALSMRGLAKQAKGMERGVANVLANQTGPLKNDPRIAAFVIWLGLVMLVAWPFIVNGRDTTPNDTVRNVLILFPITLIVAKLLANWLSKVAVAKNRWMFWAVLGAFVVVIIFSYSGAMTADSENKNRAFNKLKNQPGYTPPPRIDFGR